MKRIYNYIKNLIVTRYKLMRFITTLLFLTSCISMFYHPSVVSFGSSLACLMRLWTYSAGRIPFMKDHTLDTAVRRSRRKNSDATPDEVCKQTSLKLATIYFMIAVAGFILWIHVELIYFLLWLFRRGIWYKNENNYLQTKPFFRILR